jgi:negative regulator of flagellin synthesis FlgM
MRIDAYNAVSQIYNTSKTKKAQAYSQVGATDRFEISQMCKDLQIAKAAVAKAPDVREDVVADIKKRIEDGSYNVSDESFADVLLAKYFGV